MVSVHFILISTKIPEFTEAQLCLTPLDASHYPPFAWGVSSRLLVGAFSALAGQGSDPLAIYISVKIFAALIFSLAALWLAMVTLKSRASLLLFLLLLFSSRMPLALATTDVLAAFFFCCFCALIVDGRNPSWAGLALGLLGMSKPDMLLLAVLMAAWAWKTLPERADRVRMLSWLGASTLALVLPGFLIHGAAYLHLGGDPLYTHSDIADRALFSFGQHYARLASRFQLVQPAPDTETQWMVYLDKLCPGARNMKDVLLHYPGRYRDFLVLSLTRSVLVSLPFVLPFLLILPLRRDAPKRILAGAGSMVLRVESMLAWSLPSILPSIALAYIHYRYLIKYYPLACIWALLLWEGLRSAIGDPRAKRASVLILACVCLAVAINLGLLAQVLHGDPQDYFTNLPLD